MSIVRFIFDSFLFSVVLFLCIVLSFVRYAPTLGASVPDVLHWRNTGVNPFHHFFLFISVLFVNDFIQCAPLGAPHLSPFTRMQRGRQLLSPLFLLFLLPSIRAFPTRFPAQNHYLEPSLTIANQRRQSLWPISLHFLALGISPVQPTALLASNTRATSSRSGKYGLEKCCLSPPESPRSAPTWPALQGLPAGLWLSFVFAGFIRASKERR
jgi:hypothetical protein